MKDEITIKVEKLESSKRQLLSEAIKDTIHIVYFKDTSWDRLVLNSVYVNKEFAGVCGIDVINSSWAKVGPVIVLSKFRGKGLGKLMIDYVLKDYKDRNLFIHSSNPAMIRIIEKTTFKKLNSALEVPLRVSVYLLSKHILLNLDLNMVKYYLKKRVFQHQPKALNFVLLIK